MSDSAGPAKCVLRVTFIAIGLMSSTLADTATFGQSAIPRAARSQEPTASSQPRTNVQLTLRGIRVESTTGGSTTVVIEGNGALPEPMSGAPLNPPRIYLDFNDVLSNATVQSVAPNPVISRIRVALHSASPLITRVVIDLITATTYRIDSSARSQGRVVVVLGVPGSQPPTSSPAREPARAVPPSSATSPPAPAAKTASTVPPRSGSPSSSGSSVSRGRAEVAENQYGMRVAAALLRLHTLRPVLESIDRRTDVVSDALDAAAKEFDAIGKLLSTIKPPASREGTHALLQRVCTLGARAVRMRQDAAAATDSTPNWDAASAAAGALLMLDRANNDLAAR